MIYKIFRCAFAVAFVAVAATSATAGEVKVTLNQGLVTIIATDAPISQILSEWARVGQTKFVNAEKMMVVIPSLQLVDVPERKALDIILRSASGYMAAERRTPLAGASVFDRIMILPYSRPPAAAAVPSSPMPQPFNPRPQPFNPQVQPDDDAPTMPPGMNPQNQPTGQMTAPMPGMLPQGQQPQNGAPQPQTLPRPGFLPVPAGPQQPVPFGTPVPGKPPGGGGSGQVKEPDRR